MTAPDFESCLATLEKTVATLKEELEQTRIAARIRHGLDQVDRGQAIPAYEALESPCKKHNLQAHDLQRPNCSAGHRRT